MSQLKSLAKQTAIYGISTIALRMASWILAPYYSNAIDKVSIGINSELLAMVALFNVVYMMGMETSFFRFAKDHSSEKVFSATETSVFVNSLLWSLLFVLFATPIVNILQYPGKENYIYILSSVLFLENICNIPFASLRNQNRSMRFMGIKAINILLNVALNIFLLSFVLKGKVQLPFSVSSDPVILIFWANLIPWVLTFLYFSRDIFTHITFVNKDLLKDILRYSAPLIIVGMAGMVNETIDRVLLKYMLPYGLERNLEEVAIYSTNYKLAIIMSLAIQGFRMGAEPFFFKEAKSKNSKETYAVIMDFFIIVCCILMTLTSILREPIARINEITFIQGVRILPILLLANLFLGIYYNASIWFKLTDNTRKGAWISVIGAGVTILLNIWLIPILGYVGSALATLACYFTMTVISVIWGQRVYPIPYHFRYNILWIVGSLIFSTLSFNYFRDYTSWLFVLSFIFLLISSYIAYRRFLFIKKKMNTD